MPDTLKKWSHSQWLLALLILFLLLRLISLAVYPLMDTTEARYGEMARLMVETGNWITPQIDYGIPFWGKPPLFVWVSALSIEIFGNNEFAIRLPHYLASLLILLLIWRFALYLKLSRNAALYSSAIVATAAGYLFTTGTVMTDTLLTLAMTISMIGFWRGWHGERRYNYVMYTGLGIGLLAKGPLVIVLVGLAVFPWLVMRYGLFKLWKQLWLRLNLISGLTLMLAISLPWYLLAEQATPGFLQYFIVGEHFHRFIDSGWQGDLYGSGHARTRGSIWLYWFLFSLPWSIILGWGLVKTILNHQDSVERQNNDGLPLYLLLWMCSPLLLFTLAANILPAYVLPGIPALGLLMIKTLNFPSEKKGFWLFFVGPLMCSIAIIYIILQVQDKRSEKLLFQQGISSPHPIYYLTSRPYSAQYYSNGKAKEVKSLPDKMPYYLVIEKQQLNERIRKHCQQRSQNTDHLLLFCTDKNL